MYEYKHIGGYPEDLLDILNLHGAEGWRVASIEWEEVTINDHTVREWTALLERKGGSCSQS